MVNIQKENIHQSSMAPKKRAKEDERMDRRRKKKGGFTLIELMTVVIIVGILAIVAIPLYRAQLNRARASEGAALLGSDCRKGILCRT